MEIVDESRLHALSVNQKLHAKAFIVMFVYMKSALAMLINISLIPYGKTLAPVMSVIINGLKMLILVLMQAILQNRLKRLSLPSVSKD